MRHTLFIDVIIAAHNREDTIERAVRSALGQEFVKTVIVIDDCSQDSTAAIAGRCDPGGNQVIVERLDANLGPAAARNRAIQRSSAAWLSILDADDFFLPHRLERLVEYTDRFDLITDETIHVPADRSNQAALVMRDGDRVKIQTTQLTFAAFVRRNVTRRSRHREELGYLQPLIRRSFLEARGLRFNENLRFGEDYDLYARALAAGGRFLCLDVPGYLAVERPDSLSTRHDREALERLQSCDLELLKLQTLSVEDRDAIFEHLDDLDLRKQWLVVVEALKSHDYNQILRSFLISPSHALYLMQRALAEVPSQIHKLRKRQTTER